MKSYHYSRSTVQLDEAVIAELYKVLGVRERYEQSDIERFIHINFPEDRNFYHLVSHVLTMNGICTIMAPVNWEPSNLFYQLSRVSINRKVELVDSTKNETADAYDIHFAINGSEERVKVKTADPSALFDTINKHLSGQQFVRLVSHLKQRPSVEWLLTPEPFDSEAFKRITGCNEMREEWKPS